MEEYENKRKDDDLCPKCNHPIAIVLGFGNAKWECENTACQWSEEV